MLTRKKRKISIVLDIEESRNVDFGSRYSRDHGSLFSSHEVL